MKRLRVFKFFGFLLVTTGLLSACGKQSSDGERACLGNVQACTTGSATQSSSSSSSSTTTSTTTSTEPTSGVGSLPVAAPNSMVCVARPSRTNVRHREILSVRISVRGGQGPYYLSGYEDLPFGNVATFWGSYDNFSTADIISDRAPIVYDDTGRWTTCPFRMTIRPTTATSAPLACTLSASPSAPAPGQPVTLTVTASGAANYTFGYIQPQPGWSVTPTLLGNGQASASIQYANAGSRTVTATVRNGSRSAVCNLPITVSNLGLMLASSAGSAAGQLVVTAIPSGFNGTPSYTYEVDRNGIGVSPNGSSVTLTNASGNPTLGFKLTVTASEGGASVSKSIDLAFTTSPLTCTLQPVNPTPGNAVVVGDTRSYQVSLATGSPSDGTLTVTQLDTLPAGVTNPSGVTNPFSLNFSTAGTRTLRVKARGQTQQCNSGDWLSITIPANDPVSTVACSVFIQEGTPKVGQQIHFVGSLGTPGVSYGIGPHRLEITAIGDSRLTTTVHAGLNTLTPTMSFQLIGAATFPTATQVAYTARVVDLGDGSRASITCGNTTQLTPP